MTATAEAHDLVRRVLDAVPARSHALGALLQLFRVEASDDVPTACVSCERRPVLRVNPRFVKEHCQTDAHLFVLVMHELHHVLLGHTRLFPRVTPAHNLAFDAVVNALLCARFPEEAYTSFFTKQYGDAKGPLRLLAPPGTTKVRPRKPRRAARRPLQRDCDCAGGIPRRREGDRPRRRPARPPPRLARDGRRVGHRRPGRPRRDGCDPQDRREVAPARRPDRGPKPRRRPCHPHGRPRTPSRPRRPRRHPPRPSRSGRPRKKRGAKRRGTTPGSPPAARPGRPSSPRRPRARRHPRPLPLDSPPQERPSRGSRLRLPRRQRLDGPVARAPLQRARKTQAPPHGRRPPLLDEGRDDPPRQPFATARAPTTGGTDIACVLEHALQARPRRVLVLTDGYVGQPPEDLVRKIERRGLEIRVLLTPGGWRRDLEPIAARIEELPQ